jgi:tail tube protein gp19
LVNAGDGVMLDAAAMPGRQTESSRQFLTLDGVKCGPIRSADGGSARADVVTSSLGTSKFPSKHISTVRYEPFLVTVGFGNAATVYDWVADTWKGTFARKSGSVVVTDYKLEAKQEREFSGALLTETTLPAFDAASKEQGFLTLKFTPELVKDRIASGKQDGSEAKAKQWLRSSFRLQIDGLDCTKVTKIEPVSVKAGIEVDQVGVTKKPELLPSALEFPNLKISLSEVSATSWFDWHKDFVIKGNSDESSERSGTIQLLSADAKTELARIKLFGLGIFAISLAKAGDKSKGVTAEVYCSRMELVVKP